MLALALALSVAAALLAGVRARPPPASNATAGLPPLLDASLDELRAGLDGGRFGYEDLVAAYLARIDEFNGDLRAVIEVNPEALMQARALDAEMAAGRAARGPLHGIPVLVKDDLATRDAMNTTAGSLLMPAGSANCVGLRPTAGLVSNHMAIHISRRMDAIGPLARTVRDAAYLLAAMAGPDARDNYTAAIPDGLAGKRIGVIADAVGLLRSPGSVLRVDAATVLAHEAMGPSLQVLRAAGADMVDVELPGLADYAVAGALDHINVFMADLAHDLPEHYLKHLETNPNNLTSLQDVLDFTVRAGALEGYPQVPVELWNETLRQSPPAGSPDYWDMYNKLVSMLGDNGAMAAFAEHSLDAIVATPYVASRFSSVLGLPAVTVPHAQSPSDGPVEGLTPAPARHSALGAPLGLTFVGRAFGEEALLGMAYAFEQRTMMRRRIRPRRRPRTELADVVRRRQARSRA